MLDAEDIQQSLGAQVHRGIAVQCGEQEPDDIAKVKVLNVGVLVRHQREVDGGADISAHVARRRCGTYGGLRCGTYGERHRFHRRRGAGRYR